MAFPSWELDIELVSNPDSGFLSSLLRCFHPWFQRMWMSLMMRQISSQNLTEKYTHMVRSTISITLDALGFLGYEVLLRSKLGRGKKPSKKITKVLIQKMEVLLILLLYLILLFIW